MACVEEVGEEMTIRVEPYGKSLGTTTAIVAWTLTWLVCGVRENIYIIFVEVGDKKNCHTMLHFQVADTSEFN